jgi:hypothetical protein
VWQCWPKASALSVGRCPEMNWFLERNIVGQRDSLLGS